MSVLLDATLTWLAAESAEDAGDEEVKSAPMSMHPSTRCVVERAEPKCPTGRGRGTAQRTTRILPPWSECMNAALPRAFGGAEARRQQAGLLS